MLSIRVSINPTSECSTFDAVTGRVRIATIRTRSAVLLQAVRLFGRDGWGERDTPLYYSTPGIFDALGGIGIYPVNYPCSQGQGFCMTKIVVYGADWCPDCVRSKRLLDEHSVDYEYKDIQTDPDMAQEVIDLNIGAGFGPKRRIPTIVIDAAVLSVPSNDELAAALGIKL